MGSLPDRLMLRNGIYYARFCVPKRAAESIGRKTVVMSLHTRDPRTARSRLASRTIEFEGSIVRKLTSGDYRAPSERSVEMSRRSVHRLEREQPDPVVIARWHAAAVPEKVFAARAELFEAATADFDQLLSGDLVPLPEPAQIDGEPKDVRAYFDHLVATGDHERVVGFLNRLRLRQRIEALHSMRSSGNIKEFIDLARAQASELNRTDTFRLARMLLSEEIVALQSIADAERDPLAECQNWAVEFRASKAEAAAPVASAEPIEVRPKVSLVDLFARWESEAEPSASTLSSWRGITRDLKTFLGPKADDIAQITADDIVAWKDKLVQAGKAASTISRGYLGCAGALFRFAVANRLLSADPSQGVKVSRKEKPGTKMLPYSNEEVARLLRLASTATEPWKKWLPWLVAATGSRIGEVAQLHGSHVYTEDGIPVVKIKPAPDAGSIKNPESERDIPLHSALIKAGFLEFVKERGQGPLFYRRSSGDAKRKHASKAVTNRLAEWIRKSGFTDPRKAPNHALRHWFKTQAARVGIPDSVADKIQGHADETAGDGYRHIDVPMMAAALEQLELPPSSRSSQAIDADGF